MKIIEEKQKCLEKPACIVFLTFLNYKQAKHVFRRENLKSKFFSIKPKLLFAPLPGEILWSSVNSCASNWQGRIIYSIIILLLVIFCSTPAGFSAQILSLLSGTNNETSSLAGVSTFLPPLLLIILSVFVPLVVKIACVNFGSCSRPISHSNYMWTLYCTGGWP